MQVNYSDFESNFHKYIDYAKRSEIVLVEDGRPVMRITPFVRTKKTKTKVSELIGVFSKCRDMDLDESRKERLRKYEITD